MISCQEAKSYLTQLQDNELDLEDHLKVSNHLERCALCLKEAKELDIVWDLLDQYQGIEPSPTFKVNVWQAIQRQQKPRPFFTRWASLLSDRNWKLAAVGASMMALLALGYGIMPNPTNDQDKFDNQLLQEVNRLVNTDFDEPLSPSDEGLNARPEKSDRQLHKNLGKNPL